jgi:hypothetical protein
MVDDENFEYFGSIMNSMIGSSDGQGFPDTPRFNSFENPARHDMKGIQGPISYTEPQFQAVATLTFAPQSDGKFGSPRQPSSGLSSPQQESILRIFTCAAMFWPVTPERAPRGDKPAITAADPRPAGAVRRNGSWNGPEPAPSLAPRPKDDASESPSESAPSSPALDNARMEALLRAELVAVRARKQELLVKTQKLQVLAVCARLSRCFALNWLNAHPDLPCCPSPRTRTRCMECLTGSSSNRLGTAITAITAITARSRRDHGDHGSSNR